MIYFSYGEILFSSLSALIYGVAFGMIYQIADKIPLMIRAMTWVPKDVLFYEGSINTTRSRIKPDNIRKNKLAGNIRVLLLIYSFSIGYVLTSYYSSDGEIRLYVLALALSGVKLSYLFKKSIERILKLFSFLRLLTVFVLRIPCFPIHILLRFIKSKYLGLLRRVETHIPKWK